MGFPHILNTLMLLFLMLLPEQMPIFSVSPGLEEMYSLHTTQLYGKAV